MKITVRIIFALFFDLYNELVTNLNLGIILSLSYNGQYYVTSFRLFLTFL